MQMFSGKKCESCSGIRFFMQYLSMNRIRTYNTIGSLTAYSSSNSYLGIHCNGLHHKSSCIPRTYRIWWSLIDLLNQHILEIAILQQVKLLSFSQPWFTKSMVTSKNIISDRDPIFMRKFWQTLF